MPAGIGGHQKAYRGEKDEWLTPPEVIRALGTFDLDPCAPVIRPWDMALAHFTTEDDGLANCWAGRVWLNPPYGPETGKWLKQLADHGDGIALVFARTETVMFFDQVWGRADALLFLRGRLHFYHLGGTRAQHNSGAPSVLVAYGRKNADCLLASSLDGKFVRLKEVKHHE